MRKFCPRTKLPIRTKFGIRVTGTALLHYDELVGQKEIISANGRKTFHWLLRCQTARCKHQVPLHRVRLTGRKKCMVCAADTAYGLIKKYKTSKAYLNKIARIEECRDYGGRRRRVAFIKCTGRGCKEELRLSTTARHGYMKCYDCRHSYRRLLGVPCRNKWVWQRRRYITHAIAAKTKRHGAKWFVRCNGEGPNGEGCTTDVIIKGKNRKIKSYQCHLCSVRTPRLRKYESLYKRLKENETVRGIKVRIPFSKFKLLCCARDCFYCEKKLQRRTGWKASYAYFLDRLNNSKDYTFANVVPCCQFCNKIKGKYLSPRQMIIWASLSSQNYGRATKIARLSDAQVRACASAFRKQQINLFG